MGWGDVFFGERAHKYEVDRDVLSWLDPVNLRVRVRVWVRVRVPVRSVGVRVAACAVRTVGVGFNCSRILFACSIHVYCSRI